MAHHWHFDPLFVGPPPRAQANLWRAERLYRNQAFWYVARSMVQAHPRAIDYLEQAPVIALACLHGKRLGAKYQTFGAHQFGQMVARGERLRVIMRAYDLPIQFRSFSGHSLSLRAWPAIWRLRRLHPSTLAQIIPPPGKGQYTWVKDLVEWSRHMETRYRDGGLHIEWAAKNLGAGKSRNVAITTLADYIGAHKEHFDPRVHLEEVMRAADRWHAELARKVNEEKFLEQHGISFQHEVDFTPFPMQKTVGDYEFVALNTPEALYVEGAAMRHCVRDYTLAVVSGASRIYSIRNPQGGRVATVEFRCEYAPAGEPMRKVLLSQIQGPCGQPVPKAAKTAAMKLANEIPGVFALTRETLAELQRPRRIA